MKVLSSVLVALTLLAGSGVAMADSWHDHDQNHGRNDRGDGHGRNDGYGRNDWHGHDDGRGRDGWRGRPAYPEHRYYSDRGYYGGGPRWSRGYRYDGPMYIVNDYRGYRLAPPPYGYRWVRNNNSYLLVSIGDNMILDMVIR